MVCGDGEIMISFCTALFSFDYEKYSRWSFVMQSEPNLRADAQLLSTWSKAKFELSRVSSVFVRHSIKHISTSTEGLKLDRFIIFFIFLRLDKRKWRLKFKAVVVFAAKAFGLHFLWNCCIAQSVWYDELDILYILEWRSCPYQLIYLSLRFLFSQQRVSCHFASHSFTRIVEKSLLRRAGTHFVVCSFVLVLG